jgi:hypothetical protein
MSEPGAWVRQIGQVRWVRWVRCSDADVLQVPRRRRVASQGTDRTSKNTAK